VSRRRLYRVAEVTSGRAVAERVRFAGTHWTRLRGLIGTSGLTADEGLWIVPCRQVHMFWMRYPIDVAFLDDELRVVGLQADLRPWRISSGFPAARSALELASGVLAARGVDVGARLSIEPLA
jgi:uncharacterized membrane protein (UPF0127 family)